MDKKVEYSNGEITIEWCPGLCRHYENCTTLLPRVYSPSERRWIKTENAATDELIRQIECCPTGALSYRYNKSE